MKICSLKRLPARLARILLAAGLLFGLAACASDGGGWTDGGGSGPNVTITIRHGHGFGPGWGGGWHRPIRPPYRPPIGPPIRPPRPPSGPTIQPLGKPIGRPPKG